MQRDCSIAVHFFSPLVTRQQYAGGQLESLAEKLTAGSVAPLITHLVENKKISREEIDRIRRILDCHQESADDSLVVAKKAKPGRKGGVS